MKKIILLSLLFSLLSTFLNALDLSEDTENKGKIDRWLDVSIYKTWMFFDYNKNKEPDESFFFVRGNNQVYFINNERFDMNKDGKADLWIKNNIKSDDIFSEINIDTNYDGKDDLHLYQKNETTYLKKIESFKNGKIDQIEEYNENRVKTAEYVDTNLDGKMDDKYGYDFQNGLLLTEELDTNFDGKPDLWVFFEYNADTSMKQCTIKKDNNFDGKPDEWHYSNEKRKIVKIEKDTNFDGEIDSKKEF